MATYLVTLKSSGSNPRNRTVQVAAVDGKAAMLVAATGEWQAISATPAKESGKQRIRPFPTKALIVMCNSVASMLDAQIPLPKALEFYLARVTQEDQRLALRSIAVAVERGEDNHKAFAVTRRFDPTFVGLVKAGTMASNLPAAFRALARRMRTNQEFTSKLRKALATPICILAFLWFLLIYSQTSLVPNVEKMLRDMRVQNDPISSFTFGFSHVFQAIWMPATIGWIVLGVMFWRSIAFREKFGKLLMSRWRLLREIVMGFRQLTFVGTFEMLVSNNIPIADALETCANTLRNTPFEKELRVVKEKQALGMNLGEAMRKHTTMDPQLTHMIEVGEKASNLNEQLLLLRNLYEEETAQRIELFTGLVGVMSKLVTVSIIGFIYLGAYMPIVLAGPKMMQASQM
ncbi:MAG: type II secretion system F family protein [Verrucomicrobia bacterium]|nr:type II secretion system F family protein [Verrucomicrobiota bacterium]